MPFYRATTFCFKRIHFQNANSNCYCWEKSPLANIITQAVLFFRSNQDPEICADTIMHEASDSLRTADNIQHAHMRWHSKVFSLKNFGIFIQFQRVGVWERCVFPCWPLRVCWHNPRRANTKCSCCRQGSIGPCPPKPISSLLYPLLPSPATPVHCNTKTAGF